MPNGVVLTIKFGRSLMIEGLIINPCPLDIEKNFVLAVSYNNDEGKLTTRICQGSDAEDAWDSN